MNNSATLPVAHEHTQPCQTHVPPAVAQTRTVRVLAITLLERGLTIQHKQRIKRACTSSARACSTCSDVAVCTRRCTCSASVSAHEESACSLSSPFLSPSASFSPCVAVAISPRSTMKHVKQRTKCPPDLMALMPYFQFLHQIESTAAIVRITTLAALNFLDLN